MKGLPDPIVQDGHIAVWDRPGLGVEIDVETVRQYLRDEDRAFLRLRNEDCTTKIVRSLTV